VLEGDLEKSESKLTELKSSQTEGDAAKMTSEGLTRKVQLLEEELDAAEKNVKETVEKYVYHPALSSGRYCATRVWMSNSIDDAVLIYRIDVL
jgi:hypothetical protein